MTTGNKFVLKADQSQLILRNYQSYRTKLLNRVSGVQWQ